jgi:multidrug efflux system membrane fusion protein
MPTLLFQRSHRTVLLTLGAALVLAACSRTAPPAEPVRSVKLLTVGTSAFESGSEFAGEVRARVESRLGFRVAGKIVRRQAELGQRVKAGQVLAQLDAQDYKLAADAARAQVAAAQTNRDLAAADYKRFAALKDQNFISAPSWSAAKPRSRPRRPSWSRRRPSWRPRATRRAMRIWWPMCRV